MKDLISREKFDFLNVKGVLIDIDDTLYSYELPHKTAVQECFKNFVDEFSISISLDKFFEAYTRARAEITESLKAQGSCRSRLFAFDMLFRKHNIDNSYHHASRYESIYWESFYTKMKVNENALHFLKECKSHDIVVCAVTDMQAHIQIKKLQVLNLINYINLLVSSEEAGIEKPNEKIFSLALKKMRLDKDEVVMIGDSLDKDIKGAENLGIKAIHFKA